MPITYTTTLTVYGLNIDYDLSDQMLSFSTDLDAGIFTMGAASATFTLKNFNNQFTPNGGGTYSTTNWFGTSFTLSLAIIDGVNSTYANLFQGNVIDFKIDSGYKDSKVTFTCVDPFTYSASSQTNVVGQTSSGSIGQKINFLFDNNVQFPILNSTNYSSGAFQSKSQDIFGPITSGTPTAGSVNDLIATRYLPSGAAISWPTVLYEQLPYPGLIQYEANVLWTIPYKDTPYRAGPYYVYGDDITPVAGSMPFQSITAGYVKADFATNAQITSTTGTVTTASNGAATSTYGTKYITWPQVFNMDTVGQPYLAAALINRFNTLDYVPTDLVLSLSTIKSKNSYTIGSKFVQILDMDSGIWERLELKYKPVGTTTTVTSQTIITGRTITGTPEDIQVSIRTKQWSNWSAFILNDSISGILNTSRLGW